VDYLAWIGRLDRPCRFDVVAIDGAGGARPVVQVIENAFDP
jgi:Holliday junction resolvase-like predicted endonuclease